MWLDISSRWANHQNVVRDPTAARQALRALDVDKVVVTPDGDGWNVEGLADLERLVLGSNRGPAPSETSPRTGLRGQKPALERRLRRRPLRRGCKAGDVVHEILDVRLAQRLGRHRHRAVEVCRRLRLEAPEKLQEVGEVLASKARHLLLAGQIGPVAGGAVVTVGQLPADGGLRPVDGRGTRQGTLGRVVGRQVPHVGVAQVRREGRHLGILPASVPELDQLPVSEKCRLPGQGRDARNGRVPVQAVAAPARLGLLLSREEVSRRRGRPGRRGEDGDDGPQAKGGARRPPFNPPDRDGSRNPYCLSAGR